MATPEGKVKEAVKKILDGFNVYYFMPAANGYGRAGIPDVVCCYYGYFMALECKSASGKTTALQDRELERIRERGGAALVINGRPESLASLVLLLQKMKEKHETV